MKRIGFFGGCFNPPTNIHIKLANDLIKDKKLDKVVFVPVNDYYKKNDLEIAIHRYNMLKLATQNCTDLEVDDIEIKQNKNLYAIDAFEIIKNSKFVTNDDEIFLIMGSDNFDKMPEWKNYNEIKDKYNYIVLDRDKNDISSTEIRQMIKENNKNVKKYIPEKVYQYIINNNLFI